MKNRFYVIVNDKTYEFESGAEVYIFDAGRLNGVAEDKLMDYVAFVKWLYLKDQNPTPLGHICDYIAEHWEEVQSLDKWTILENFYDSIN